MGQCRGLWPSDGLLDNDDFRVPYFYDYGIYAGFKGAKRLISLKDAWIQGTRKWWSEASNWLQVLQRFVFFVAVMADSMKISWRWMSYNQVSCLLLRSCLINYHMGPFYEHNWLFIISDSTNHLFIWISTCLSIYWRETSDDDTLLNGLKYSRLPVTRTFS